MKKTKNTILLFLFLLGLGAAASPARGDSFTDVVLKLILKKENINSEIEIHENKSLSADIERLQTKAWPTLSVQAFARQYYLNETMIDTTYYGILTSQNVLGVGFTISQDLMGIVTGGYQDLRKPMQSYLDLTMRTERMDRTKRYIEVFVGYLIHLRQQGRILKGRQLLQAADQYSDPMEDSSVKLVDKISLDSILKQSEVNTETEELICHRYEKFLNNLGLQTEIEWAKTNAMEINLKEVAALLANLDCVHDYPSQLRKKIRASINEELNARESISWLDNLSLNLNFHADAFGDGLGSQETYGQVSLEYAFNDPDKLNQQAQREGLESKRLNSENEDLSLGDYEITQNQLSEMDSDEFLKIVESLGDQDKNFDSLFKLVNAGIFKTSVVEQSVSEWTSSEAQMETLVWQKIAEILVAHEYAVITKG